MNIDLRNKKIGIWGLGVVGKSALQYVQNYTNHIQILDKTDNPQYSVITQTPQTILDFLQYNDLIIPSPGIQLHEYQQYRDKFICELDIFQNQYHEKTIAITGTVGKTTVTSFIQQLLPNSIAAGNIGHAMLDVLAMQPQPKNVVLELSSYQLQYAQDFAPDIAVWTNFYPNHLDHHQSINEYFQAKCMMLQHQTKDQKALIPYELLSEIVKVVQPKARLFTMSMHKPEIIDNTISMVYIQDNNLVVQHHKQTTIIFKNMDQLPDTTFIQNWITILATLHLAGQNIENLDVTVCKPAQHRVQFVTKFNNVAIYNDSKSTIWQSTQQALSLFPSKKIALFIGGLSKGANREPLIEYIAQQKNITVFIFGKEQELLSAWCVQYHVPHYSASTLQQALQLFVQHHTKFDILLFSPAGSSFDLFKNYQDRGEEFKKIIQNISLHQN